jgi:16S rRNA (cytidine1402-2'-O)-methyltransferase
MTCGTLYVVATPLGNLSDLSARAIETLRRVGVIAAEDTRHTRRLLSAIEASPRRLIAYHAHADARRAETLLEILAEGEDIALVTDAGTPAISDPGYALVAAAHAAGVRVVPIPGPNAVATALAAGGLPGDRYLFLGFLPRKGRDREAALEEIARSRHTAVVFEAANRLVPLLDDLARTLGPEHEVVVARELTKLHEEIRRAPVEALVRHYGEHPPLGEVTVLVAGSRGERDAAPVDTAAIQRAVQAWLVAGESRREAVRKVVDEFGLPRNDAYRLVMDA